MRYSPASTTLNVLFSKWTRHANFSFLTLAVDFHNLNVIVFGANQRMLQLQFGTTMGARMRVASLISGCSSLVMLFLSVNASYAADWNYSANKDAFTNKSVGSATIVQENPLGTFGLKCNVEQDKNLQPSVAVLDNFNEFGSAQRGFEVKVFVKVGNKDVVSAPGYFISSFVAAGKKLYVFQIGDGDDSKNIVSQLKGFDAGEFIVRVMSAAGKNDHVFSAVGTQKVISNLQSIGCAGP